jgi:TolB protein
MNADRAAVNRRDSVASRVRRCGDAMKTVLRTKSSSAGSRLISSLIVALATTLASLFLVGSAARATPPGENGRIVFRRWFDDAHNWGALFSIEPDGTGEQQITHPRPRVGDDRPDVSPNGKWIVYDKKWQRRPGHPGAIFRIRMNGTGRKNLTGDACGPENDCVRDINPTWSPDGRWIAFSRVFGSETRRFEIDLFVMRANGTDQRQITAPGPLFEDYDPEWSPDGARLVFFRSDPNRQLDALFTVDPDGSDLVRMTRWHLNVGYGDDWSPNGRWIVFSAAPDGQTYNLRMIHPDGTGLHRITFSNDKDWLGSSFSSDGRWIVAGRTGGVGEDGNADVFVMRLDGSHRRNITRTDLWDSAPDWGPRPTHVL